MAGTFKIGSITFDGANGTIQTPKPLIETYTVLGDNRIFTQKINTSSNQSEIVAFKALAETNNVTQIIDALKLIIGKKTTIDYNNVSYPSSYLIDYSYTFKKVGSCLPIVAVFTLSILTDERT